MPNTTPIPIGSPDTLTTTAPERIWLQIDTYGDPNNRSMSFPQDSDVTWCRDSVGGVEVEYVRADLASAAQPPITYAPPSPTLGVAPSGPGTNAALAAAPKAAPASAAVAHQGAVAWPVMPPSKGQSPVLFEDGYAEGWAKCLEACQAALAAAPTPAAQGDA